VKRLAFAITSTAWRFEPYAVHWLLMQFRQPPGLLPWHFSTLNGKLWRFSGQKPGDTTRRAGSAAFSSVMA